MTNMINQTKELDQKSVNAIRFLCVDAIQKANSGHPGVAMGAAPMAFVLWNRHLRFNPKNPDWYNRDRFILSAGHGSMLQYALLHLTGYDCPTIEDIKNFRQWKSKTPGHPENTVTPGVEVTTGPLGQGIANAVGMAIAEKHMAARFNKPDCKIVEHTIYTILGDGCQMEGITSEACSLAGHLGLDNLIALYDDNRISIDGPTDITFTENVGKRFESYGWQVLYVEDGNTDLAAIENAIAEAKATKGQPSLICIRTTIGYGSPAKSNSADCHGAPLGKDEVQAAREQLGWQEPPFTVPQDVASYMGGAVKKGAELEDNWNRILEIYKEKYPNEAEEFQKMISGALPLEWWKSLPTFTPEDPANATRSLSGNCLNSIAQSLPYLIGGSADLSPSNKTTLKNSGFIQKENFGNNNIYFGVREHAMGAICNGIALHGSGLIPYAGTFLSFSDYMRGAIRVAAVSCAGTLFIMTHDSIAVGEDGPTHQPVEHISSLRAIPGLVVLRPADGNETSGAYKFAIEDRKRPSLLALTRQKVPNLSGTSVEAVRRGAYVISDCDGTPDLILIGTGSELSLCAEAALELTKNRVKVRVVSMPSFELFEEQDEAYRESVLPKAVVRRVAVEAGTSLGWHRYVGLDGATITIDRFGTSAPGGTCLERFGFTVDNVIETAKKLIG